MFVFSVVSTDKKEKCRTVKTKKQVRMKYRVQENTKKKKMPVKARFSAGVRTGPGAHPASYIVTGSNSRG